MAKLGPRLLSMCAAFSAPEESRIFPVGCLEVGVASGDGRSPVCVFESKIANGEADRDGLSREHFLDFRWQFANQVASCSFHGTQIRRGEPRILMRRDRSRPVLDSPDAFFDLEKRMQAYIPFQSESRVIPSGL